MADLSQIREARNNLDQAQEVLNSSAKSVLKETLTEVFVNDNVHMVIWGQKQSEYNDEGLYEGVHGPLIFDEDSAPNLEDRDIFYDLSYDLGGYNGRAVNPGFSDETKKLREIFDLLGEKLIVDATGGYDEFFVIAYRNDKAGGGYSLDFEYAGV